MSTHVDPSLNFDDLSEGDDDPDLPLLREFLDRWETAETREERGAILQEYGEKYPRLAERFRGLVQATSIVRDAEDQDPVRLGPYRIIRILAIGGMGKVYEAEDEDLARTVAVKTIRIGRAADPKLLERFEYEREALARLHHTHIVPIYSAGEDDGLLYFAMPLIRGPSLADLVATISRWPSGMGDPAQATSWEKILGRATTDATWRRSVRRLSALPGGASPPAPSSQSGPEPTDTAAARPPLTEDYFRHVAEVLAVVAEALHSAHEAGVLHFDIKPSNILIERVSGVAIAGVHPWIIDFGLAEAGRGVTDGLAPGEHGNNHRTRGFGTRGFMAPEMIRPRDISGIMAPPACEGRAPLRRQTDVWSLGVTLYQLLTLRMPFADDGDVLDPKAGPRGPREHVPHLPRELEAVVLKALEKPQEDRYATAGAFAEDLRRWLAGIPTEAGGAGLLERTVMWARRRPAAAFAAGMTAAFAVVSLLGAGQVVRVARAEARIAEQEVEARKRELDLLAIPRMRAPIRSAGWAEKSWDKTRELAGGRPDADGRFQAEFAALLDGLDVRLAKPFEKDADMLAFDPKGKRLLMGWGDRDARGSPVTRLIMGDLAGQQAPTEKSFKNLGVVGFGREGTALFLEQDAADLSILRLRDAITGAEKRILKSPRNGMSKVNAIALSRDGSRTAGVVWPLRKRTPEEMAAVADKADEMTPAGDTATLVVWEVDTGRGRRSIEDKQTPTYGVTLSPDGSLLATWDASGRHHEVSVWSVGDGTPIDRLPSAHSTITGVAFGRDPAWRDDTSGAPWRLAVGEKGGQITVWDLRKRIVKCIARGTDHDVKTLDFSPDGALLTSAGRDYLKIWDAASGECLLKVPAGSYQFAVAFSPDGRRVAVSKTPVFSSVRGVDVFDLDGGRGLRTLRGLSQRIEKVAISADGRRIAALTNDWEVGVFDTLSGALLGVADAPEGYFTDNAALALNADGSRLVCSAGTQAKLWDVGARRLLRKWELPPALTEAAGFRRDGHLLLIRQETKGGKVPPFGSPETHPKNHPRVCRVYGLSEQGDKTMVSEILDFDWYVEHIAATPNGAYFVIQGNSRSTGKPARFIHLYDGSTGKQVGSIPTAIPPDSTAGMRFDPEGTRLCVPTKVRSPADLVEVPSLRSLGPVEVDGSLNVGASRGVRYSRPTPGTPGMVIVTDRSRPEPFLRIVRDVDASGTDAMKFSQDGNQIIWGNQDGTVTVCDLNEVQRRLAGVGLGW